MSDKSFKNLGVFVIMALYISVCIRFFKSQYCADLWNNIKYMTLDEIAASSYYWPVIIILLFVVISLMGFITAFAFINRRSNI